jgi:energy-coupling factor transporter ATP-binding protein EcfA2
MKLQSITLCDFRGFPGPGEYTFDFGKHNHLLIYGENGSGKTSVFKALVEFFNLDPKPATFSDFKNLFSDEAHSASLICGKVSLTLDSPPSIQTWVFTKPGQAAVHPTAAVIVKEMARRKGFFDYRSLIKANFAETDAYGKLQRPNLFRLMVIELLHHCPVTISGGTVASLGTLWEKYRDVNNKNQDFRSGSKAYVQAAQKAFDDAVIQLLPTLKARSDILLSKYFEHAVELTYQYVPTKYRSYRAAGFRDIKDGQLTFGLTFKGKAFTQHEEVLNEAKLSAVALAVYFAALLETVPSASTAPYPRILVLDDVLIGLDMANRQPVLKLLAEEFAEIGWQIILLTHDKVWYDYAAHVSSALKWSCHELYADHVPDDSGGVLDKPFLRKPDDGAGDYLARADHQLKILYDHKAAAMYARGAYERALKNFCAQRALLIPYKPDSNKIDSNTFFSAVRADIDDANRKVKGVLAPVPPTEKAAALAVMSQIELHRQQVLNPMSHSASVSITKPEVVDAIQSVRELISALAAVSK